jgi:phospholipid/cholesterol/gamma-HCH transport system permease protein
VVFGFLIVSVSSFYGYYVKGGSINVGQASTQAVVSSSIAILVANLILTQLLLLS